MCSFLFVTNRSRYGYLVMRLYRHSIVAELNMGLLLCCALDRCGPSVASYHTISHATQTFAGINKCFIIVCPRMCGVYVQDYTSSQKESGLVHILLVSIFLRNTNISSRTGFRGGPLQNNHGIKEPYKEPTNLQRKPPSSTPIWPLHSDRCPRGNSRQHHTTKPSPRNHPPHAGNLPGRRSSAATPTLPTAPTPAPPTQPTNPPCPKPSCPSSPSSHSRSRRRSTPSAHICPKWLGRSRGCKRRRWGYTWA